MRDWKRHVHSQIEIHTSRNEYASVKCLNVVVKSDEIGWIEWLVNGDLGTEEWCNSVTPLEQNH